MPASFYSDIKCFIKKVDGCKNSPDYDQTIINQLFVKELVKEFEGEFSCLGENMEKYIIFSVPIEKK